MATRPWTKTDAARLAELHGQGQSLHSIAKTMDRAKGTLSRKAKEAGLVWDRAQVNAATEAKVRDAKSRKADSLLIELEILELSQARVVRTLRGEAKWDTMIRETGGAEKHRQLDFIPTRDAREAAGARSSSTAIIDRLAAQADDRDLPAVDAWLEHVTGGPKSTFTAWAH